MLKVLGVHFISGIFVAVIREIVPLFPDSMQLGFIVAASIIMVVYYLLAGVFLKNESFHKVVLLTQILAYIGHMAAIIIKTSGKYILFPAGGSVIWNGLLGRLLSYGDIANCLAYILMFFAAPAFIALGMKIAGKGFEINVKKEGLSALCVSVLFLILNTVYPIARNFIKKTGEPIETVKAGIAVLIILLLSIAGGFVLRKIDYSKIYFIMMNLSFVGITFCFFFNSFFLYAFCGAEMMFDLFFDLAFQSNPELMFFVPPLFVLFGSLLGRKLIKDETGNL